MSAKLINTLKVNTELDFPFASQRPLNTSSVPVEVEVGFKLPYMPLSSFAHLESCFATKAAKDKGGWLTDPDALLMSALKVSPLSLSASPFAPHSAISSLTVSAVGSSNSGEGSHSNSNSDNRTQYLSTTNIDAKKPHSSPHQLQHQRELPMSEERMAMLFQKPSPHIASHLQRNLVYQSGQMTTPYSAEHSYPRGGYQQQQPHQPDMHGHGATSGMSFQEQQQWQQKQVVAASTKKQQQSSRQIGKLQPQLPHQPTPLFSNARYNPTTRRKTETEVVDPVIAATAASIAATASAALKEVSVAYGTVPTPSPPQLNRPPPPAPASHSQQYSQPSPIQSYQLPRPQSFTQPPMHMVSPPSPWQQARGNGDVGLQNMSRPQPFGGAGQSDYLSSVYGGGRDVRMSPQGRHAVNVPRSSPHFESFEPPQGHLSQQAGLSAPDIWQQQMQHASHGGGTAQPVSVDRAQGQRLYERTQTSSMVSPDVSEHRLSLGLGLGSGSTAFSGGSGSTNSISSRTPSSSGPPVKRNYQSELFESIDFAAPPPAESSNDNQGAGPSSEYEYW